MDDRYVLVGTDRKDKLAVFYFDAGLVRPQAVGRGDNALYRMWRSMHCSCRYPHNEDSPPSLRVFPPLSTYYYYCCQSRLDPLPPPPFSRTFTTPCFPFILNGFRGIFFINYSAIRRENWIYMERNKLRPPQRGLPYFTSTYYSAKTRSEGAPKKKRVASHLCGSGSDVIPAKLKSTKMWACPYKENEHLRIPERNKPERGL